MKQNYSRKMQTDKVLSELLHIANENIRHNGDTTLMNHIVEAMQVVEKQTGKLFIGSEANNA